MQINWKAHLNRMKRASLRPHAENIQHASQPRNEHASGNELKQSVTKRNFDVKSRFSSLPNHVWTSRMKGLTTH
ncbi:hypothetical protein FCJ61_34980 [Burkholderia metallica]|nr:hypothetical protein [Burkholderia metallica]